MSKILVLQVEIGRLCYPDPYLENAQYDFEKYLRPSVISYCKKYGYDYKLVSECPEELNISWFKDPYPTRSYRNIGSTLVRYYHMYAEGYDYVLSLDNDIYITETADPIPLLEGHTGVHDCDIEKRRSGHQSLNKSLSYDYNALGIGVINGGVQIADSKTGLLIKKYFKHICDNQIPPLGGYFSDQNYINYFRSRFSQYSKLIPEKWNFMVNRHNYSSYEGVNFVHFAASIGRQKFYQDLENGLIKQW